MCMSITSVNEQDKLNNIIAQQEALLASLKEEAKALEESSIARENEQLKSELKASNEKSSSLAQENSELKKQLSTAKSALFAKMANEKLAAFSSVQRKINYAYYTEEKSLESRLDEYERNCRKSIDLTVKAIETYGVSEYKDIIERLEALNAELDERHRLVEQYKNEQITAAKQTNNAIGKGFENEPLTENEKRTGLKQKNLESFIGLNVLSKAGIFLFLVGIVMLGRFAYVHLPNTFKGLMIFLLGGVLIGVGEIFHKKEKSAFSTALISGGVAVLYAAAATCYFAFSLYGVRATFVICIAITAGAIALSNQIKSQVVCAFGAVGGYLPVVAAYMIGFGFGKVASDASFLPVSSVYFCVLASIIFVMTYNKKWYAAQFIGYALHLIAIGGIARCAWAMRNVAGYGYALGLACGFAVVSFIIYLLMPASKIIKGRQVQTGDTVLLGLNTISGAISVSITLYNCFEKGVANRAVGFVFLVFAVLYAVLMKCSNRETHSPQSTAVTAISSVSALLFSMLVVPFIFGAQYGPVAWAVEGAVLAVFSVYKKIGISEAAGLLCLIISATGSFWIWFDSYNEKTLHLVTFTVVLLAFWVYCIYGLGFNESPKSRYKVLEIFLSVGTYCYLVYLYGRILEGPFVNMYSSFTGEGVKIIFILLIAMLLRKGVLKNNASMHFSNIAGLVVLFVTFIRLDIMFNYKDVVNYYLEPTENKGYFAFNIVLLLAINVLTEIFFAKCVGHLLNETGLPMWIYTAAISVSSLMLITAVLMEQFGVRFTSVIISGIYIAAACVLLVVGFKKRYTVVRSGGLVIILCAFAKLCFVDTSHLDSGWKIASYFAFGALLIVISYVYQRFSKKLEEQAASMLSDSEEISEAVE